MYSAEHNRCQSFPIQSQTKMTLFRHVLTRFRKNISFLIRFAIILLLLTAIYFMYSLPGGDRVENVEGLKIKSWPQLSSVSHSIDSKHLKEFHALNPVIDGWGENGQAVYL